MTTAGAHRRWPRWLARGAAAVVASLVVAVGVWLLLLPDVEQAPLDAVLDDPDVTVTIDHDGATIAPAAGAAGTTVVFYPGAGVPPAAYLPTWAPVVEDVGVRVIIPSMPLGLAVLDRDAATEVRARTGGDGAWWVGGHSLGGAMAAAFLVDTEPGAWDGLVLWAAYPAGDGLAQRDDLRVVSVAGERDGLTTRAEVDASRADLPPSTTITVLDGVNHAQFGAYGDQRGDNTATVDDDRARALVATATADVLER